MTGIREITEAAAAAYMYAKLGFQVEGKKRDSVCVDGQHRNEVAMSNLL